MLLSLFLPYSPATPNCLLINLHFAQLLQQEASSSLEQCYDALLKYEARLIFICVEGILMVFLIDFEKQAPIRFD